jgi:hypothetical protein
VSDERGLAVHELVGVGDGCAEGFGDRLVTEADAEQGLAGGERCGDDRHADSCRRGGARSWGEQHSVVVRETCGHVIHAECVVAQHLGLSAELQQVAVERVDEAVVVVDDEDAGH